MCVYIYIYTSIYLYLSIYLYISLYIYIYTYLYLSLYISLSLYIYIYIYIQWPYVAELDSHVSELRVGGPYGYRYMYRCRCRCGVGVAVPPRPLTSELGGSTQAASFRGMIFCKEVPSPLLFMPYFYIAWPVSPPRCILRLQPSCSSGCDMAAARLVDDATVKHRSILHYVIGYYYMTCYNILYYITLHYITSFCCFCIIYTCCTLY